MTTLRVSVLDAEMGVRSVSDTAQSIQWKGSPFYAVEIRGKTHTGR